MRSGIGPLAELERHSIDVVAEAPGVGANLIDHPRVPLIADLSSEAIRLSEGKHHSRPSAMLRYTARGSNEFNDMQLNLNPIIDWTMLSGFPVGLGVPPKLIAFPALQRPRSRGRLTLLSCDPEEQPNIELNYLADPEDMRRMLDGMRLAWRILHQPTLAAGWHGPILGETGQILDETTVASHRALMEFIRNNCTTLYHPVGTVKMEPASDSMAVVDQYCRVRGVEGLRVADASVMPNIVRANTNLTCIMIGERVANWVLAEPRLKMFLIDSVFDYMRLNDLLTD
jgi:choline dehydrogenase